MAVIKTKGIIIKRINLGEADKIITIITQNRGKIRVVAKGVRKPHARLSGFLEMFHYNEYLLAEGRNLDIVTGANTLDTLHGISRDLKSIALAYYMAEIIDGLIEETQDPGNIFDLIYSTFREISKGNIKLSVIKSFFEINILNILGFRPELDKCVECGQPIVSGGYFSFNLGGLLDNEHQSKDVAAIDISDKEINVLRRLLVVNISDLDVDADKLGLEDNSKLVQICSGFLNHIIGKRIQSKEFWHEMSNFS